MKSTTCLALAGFVLAGCHRSPKPHAPADLPVVPVETLAAESRTEPVFEPVVGTVRARTSAVVEAKVTSRISELSVIPGQAVEKGQRLVGLDAQEWQARLDQAEAALRQASRDLDRYRELLKSQAVTQAEFDAVSARFQIAQAADLEAKTTLGYTEILAPFAGIIARKLADPGDLASPGRPLLELEDPQDLQLEANVPEALISGLALGQTCAVQVATLSQVVMGKIAEMAPAGDAQSRTFPVKFDLPAEKGLRSGQFGRVFIPAGTSRFLRVPRSAVHRQGQLEYLFVVTNKQARLRLVKTGAARDQEVELLSGLEPEEQVVVVADGPLVDGQPVTSR